MKYYSTGPLHKIIVKSGTVQLKLLARFRSLSTLSRFYQQCKEYFNIDLSRAAVAEWFRLPVFESQGPRFDSRSLPKMGDDGTIESWRSRPISR